LRIASTAPLSKLFSGIGPIVLLVQVSSVF